MLDKSYDDNYNSTIDSWTTQTKKIRDNQLRPINPTINLII